MVKYGRSKIRQSQKEPPRGFYDTPSKYKAKLVVDTTLNTTPTTEAHRAVAAVIKKRKSEGDDATTVNNVHIKQVDTQRGEAQLAISKHAMANRPLLLAENVATAKFVPPNKYAGKYKISMLNRVTMIILTVR